MPWNIEGYHPFSFHPQEQVESYAGKHHLWIYPDALWVVDEKDLTKGKRRVYNRIAGVINDYEMTANEIKEFQARLELGKVREKNRQEKLKTITKPLEGAKSVNFKKNETALVVQHEYAIASATSDQTILGTYGASTCLILAIYDDKNKIAFLAHIDAGTDLNCLVKILLPFSKKDTVAHLLGGQGSEDLCLEVMEILEKETIKIINSDTSISTFEGASLAIDARNGNIFSPVYSGQLHKTGDEEYRLKLAGIRGSSHKTPLREFKPPLLSKSEAVSGALNETKQENMDQNGLTIESKKDESAVVFHPAPHSPSSFTVSSSLEAFFPASRMKPAMQQPQNISIPMLLQNLTGCHWDYTVATEQASLYLANKDVCEKLVFSLNNIFDACDSYIRASVHTNLGGDFESQGNTPYSVRLDGVYKEAVEMLIEDPKCKVSLQSLNLNDLSHAEKNDTPNIGYVSS